MIKQSDGGSHAAADEDESDKSKSEVNDDDEEEEGTEEVCNYQKSLYFVHSMENSTNSSNLISFETGGRG